MESIKYTSPWLTDIITKNIYSDDFIEYALTDIGYRNTATIMHYVLFVKYITDLKKYKSKSLENISLIDKKIVELQK